MPHKTIKYKSKHLFAHKSVRNPDFNSTTVLTNDPWQYVNLWMDRTKNSKACFFWEQARGFYNATKNLPPTSAPLTAYYAIMNATKAMLQTKGQSFGPYHGVSGDKNGGKTALTNEMVTFSNGGVHAALRNYLREPTPYGTYTLKDILYNLPFIHRSFCLTYSSARELFIPIQFPRFVKKVNSTEAWFCADIQGGQYQNKFNINKLPKGYERDHGIANKWTIRLRKRFRWKSGTSDQRGNITRLKKYHELVRRKVRYIHGTTRLWYIKRSKVNKGYLEFHNMTLIFAAMHRLSELARYSPDELNKHFDCQHNWLLNEFISMALDQFIDNVASEITGHDFMPVGLRAQ